MNYCVITTINNPTKAIVKLYEHFGENLIIVGDKKTPADWRYNGNVPIRDSNKLYAPDNHYARKNLGYMEAIKNKAELIYDTDDDNIPNENWKVREIQTAAAGPLGGGWVNVYNLFSHDFIWPRGFSIKNLKTYSARGYVEGMFASSIQQGLSDGEPDVDAIWRLALHKEINFTDEKSIYLRSNTWCPFNSQSTWWFPKAYPLMYLPVYATFRMTDIWRSFIAQRCLWELGEGVTFHSPSEVFQERNEHDLMKDFEQEVPGYLNNDRIVEILSDLKLKAGEEFVCENLKTCYWQIVFEGILPEEELISVQEWINDYENATGNME